MHDVMNFMNHWSGVDHLRVSGLALVPHLRLVSLPGPHLVGDDLRPAVRQVDRVAPLDGLRVAHLGGLQSCYNETIRGLSGE